MTRPVVHLEGVCCSIDIRRPRPGLLMVSLRGTDAGELGDAPFVELAPDMASGQRYELFIDAREGRAASIDVSGAWAAFLGKHRERFVHVSMLTASRFIQLSADLVKRFAGLGELMRIYTDPVSFDAALREALERPLDG